MNLIIYVVAALAGGFGVGVATRNYLAKKSIRESEQKQKELLLKAKDEALKIKEEATREEATKRKYLEEIERDLRRKEESIDRRAESIDSERENVLKKEKEIREVKSQILKIKDEQQEALQKVAKMKKEEAKELLLSMVEKEYREDLVGKIKAEKQKAKDEAEVVAREIISTVVERLAAEHTSESTVASVTLPSDEMKGRIIGREGRNIQIFEKVTGVDVLIDDTPDTVTISSFDPIRRHVAKVALEKLISDGRIQPSRIEEIVEKVKKDTTQEIKEAGEQAAYEVGVVGLDPDLVKILGRLKFRTSYGQNVLRHSIEVAHLAGMLAAELNADVNMAKKAGLLHDLGKAVDHEVPGAHHHISMDIAKRYGLSEKLINAIGAHHEDIEPKTVEAILVRAADAISGARPGARRESLESYIKRLTELENIANTFPGVEKSYAIQAGREVRIIVRPQEVDDLSALKLSKNIAKKIEQDLQYPGTIKVNVIRETRATEYAK
jgi:ribonuclease Y